MNATTEAPRPHSRTNWFMMLLNLLAVVGLLLAYLAAWAPPRHLGYLSLAGLAYPFSWIANALFVLYWLFKKRRNMLWSVLAILLGWGHMDHFIQFGSSSPPADTSNTLRLLTYNTRLFGAYSKNSHAVRDGILQMLQKEKADVLCFQEFFYSDSGPLNTRDTLLTLFPDMDFHERYTHALKGRKYFGVALFSRFPIINKGSVPFESDANNFCIYADILFQGDTVRIYNAHLASIRLQPEDYDFVSDNEKKEKLEDGSKRIARRLKNAFLRRESQTERLAASIRECPFPVILCGDFNDTPVSYCYTSLTSILDDSFDEAGSGIGNTYIGPFPSFRIDYVLHSPSLQALEYRTLPETFSDHHPVEVTLGLD